MSSDYEAGSGEFDLADVTPEEGINMRAVWEKTQEVAGTLVVDVTSISATAFQNLLLKLKETLIKDPRRSESWVGDQMKILLTAWKDAMVGLASGESDLAKLRFRNINSTLMNYAGIMAGTLYEEAKSWWDKLVNVMLAAVQVVSAVGLTAIRGAIGPYGTAIAAALGITL